MDKPQQAKETSAAYTTSAVTTIQLSAPTYDLLTRRAQQINRTPDALADEVLQRELEPAHPYVTLETSHGSTRAVLKETRTPVSVIIGYIQIGLKAEAFAEEVHPALTQAHIYDALSYYYDHRDAIDREIMENTEAVLRQQLRSHMRSEADFVKITGRSN